MNILYVAYSCSPIYGSEDKVGWRVAIEQSKRGHNVFVVTKEEHRSSIEEWKRANKTNICFHYVGIPQIYKKLFKGFLYSGRLNIWHKKALPVVKKIAAENNIDIIHQTTPVEFRAIGNYGNIGNAKFVCGPLGGGEFVPFGLWAYIKGHCIVELLRYLSNVYYRTKYIINGRFRSCDCLLFANTETKKFCLQQGLTETELGLDYNNILPPPEQNSKICEFLVSGRLIYRKGLFFLLDVLEQIKDECPYTLRIVGGGSDFEKLRQRIQTSVNLSKHVILMGKIPFAGMETVYAKTDVLIMPSIRETTGTVLFEAIENGLPIIAMNRFGSGMLLNEEIGWTFGGHSKQEYMDSLRNAIMACIEQPNLVRQKKMSILTMQSKYSWKTKAARYEDIYNKVLKYK